MAPKAEARLREEVSADPLSRLVERAGGLGEPLVAEEANDAGAQLALLHEHEDDEHKDQDGAAERLDDQRELPERVRPGDGHGDGLRGGGTRALELGQHVLGRVLDLFERPALADALHVRDLPHDGRAVARKVVCERGDLVEQPPAEPKGEQDRQGDDADDRRDLAQAGPAKEPDDGAQKERDEQGQRDRDEDGARPVETPDREDEGGQDDEPRRTVRVDGP